MLLTKIKEIRNNRMIKKTTDVSYEVIWKEKQGGSEQRRVFPSKEEADRFVAHKERVDSRSYGVIVLKTTDDDKNKDPFIQRQIEIAKKTLKMPGAMVGVMGGMTKAEAKEILKKYGVSEDSYDPTQPKNIAEVKDGVKERINYKGWMIVVYDDGDVLLTDPYNNSVGWPEYNSVEKAKRDIDKSMKEGLYDSKDEAIDPTTPKNIAKAKSLSVAQGKAATGDSDGKQQVFNLLEKWWNAPSAGFHEKWANKGVLIDRLVGEIPELTRKEATEFHEEWARGKGKAATGDKKMKDADNWSGELSDISHDLYRLANKLSRIAGSSIASPEIKDVCKKSESLLDEARHLLFKVR